MFARRYEVYEIRESSGHPFADRIDSIPDDLVEEAAKALIKAMQDPDPIAHSLARAALSVLFPKEEE